MGSGGSAQSLLPTATASDGEAEDVVDDVLDLLLLLEFFAQLVAGVRRRARTEGLLPTFLEPLLGDFPIDAADLALRATCLVNVRPEEKIPLSSATLRSHGVYLLKS